MTIEDYKKELDKGNFAEDCKKILLKSFLRMQKREKQTGMNFRKLRELWKD